MFEFGIGEAVPLAKQDGFKHGQQGIGGTTAVVSKVTGSLRIECLGRKIEKIDEFYKDLRVLIGRTYDFHNVGFVEKRLDYINKKAI